MTMHKGFIIKTALLYLRRSYRSTLVLGVMIFAAVACLVLLSALAVGTNDAMIRNSVGLYSGHIAASGLPAGLDPGRLAMAGTAGVLIRQIQPATIANSNGSRMESVLLTGVDPLEEKRLTALWKKTLAGHYLVPGQPAIYLSRPLAQILRVSVGDSLRIKTEAQETANWTVCGIYRTGVSQLDHGLAFCPRQFLPESGATVSAAVFLEEGVAPEPILKIYRQCFESSQFVSWSGFMPDLKQLIDLNFVSMTIVMLLVFGIVSLGIACAFVIFILKSIREFGILKAMGIFAGEIMALILAQVTILTLAASLAGTAAGTLAVNLLARTGIDLTAFTSHNPYFAVSGVIHPRLTLFSVCSPALLALVFGSLAAVWPSIIVIRKKTADILRSI